MTDVERVIKFGEYLRANPMVEKFLHGFLCGCLFIIAFGIVLYFYYRKGGE